MTREVSGGARPWILLDAFGKAGPQGVSFDIAKRDRQMGGVQRVRIMGVLPEVSGTAAAAVSDRSVAAVRAAQGDGERGRFFRYGYEMDMIRHEAVSENTEARLMRRASEQSEVNLAVGPGKENAFAVGSALRDMMRSADGDHTGKSRHLER